MVRRRVKKRNMSLFILGIILFFCFVIEISYTHWIFHDYPDVLWSLSSSDLHSCYKNSHFLLNDCLYHIASLHNDNFRVDNYNNLRFIGDNPDNYVDLGQTYTREVYVGVSKADENDKAYFETMSDCMKTLRKCKLLHSPGDKVLWRIVGVFPDNYVNYVKLVADESIGSYAYDSSIESINGGYGVNDFNEADLKVLLNDGAYFNHSKGTCYTGPLEQKKDCDFSLYSDITDFIEVRDWFLGSINENDYSGLVSNWYDLERKDNNVLCLEGGYCTDTSLRINKVSSYYGLLYPSDVLYATRSNECLDIPVGNWSSVNSDCVKDNWLYNNNLKSWLITPYSSVNSRASVLTYSDIAGFKETFAGGDALVYPSIYLKSRVKILSGYGTKEKPYLISL